jgi:hypothetical protein
MTFVLREPFRISPRLTPSVRIGESFISIEYAGRTTPDGRTVYRYHLDLDGIEPYTAEDIHSGVGGGSIRSGMRSLLSFLESCGEANRASRETPGENADLFPKAVGEWCYQHLDEISSMILWVEGAENCCVEAD